jgi:hypothetical protein
MKTTMHDMARLILLSAAAAGCSLAQQPTHEIHVNDIRAEQPQNVLLASPLCERARANGHAILHTFKVDPATLEPSLAELMEKSDEVVLVGQSWASYVGISPSGNDIAEYFDAAVLRSWKGSHKIGDMITYAIPSAHLNCSPSMVGEPVFLTFAEGGGWKGDPWGPKILFLRQSRGEEAQFIPGLRLTGGDGLQGAYMIPFPLHDSSCFAVDLGHEHKHAEACRARVEASQIPISAQYRPDPLYKTYDGMSVSSFLQEVDSVARSLGYAAPAHAVAGK